MSGPRETMGLLDGSDAYTFTSRAEVPYERLRGGDGYDVLRGQALPSPLKPFQLSPEHPTHNFDFDSTTVETARDIENVVNLSTGISASAFKIGVEATARYLQSVTYSDTCLTTVIRVARICPDIVYASRPQLTPEAQQLLLQGTSKFFEQHGQYFVCGYRSQVSLVATLTHTAQSSERLKQFKSELGVNYKITSVKSTADLMQKATSSDIATTTKIYMEGYEGPSSAEPLTTQELVSVLEDFFVNRDKHKPVPRVALLEHYCWNDQRLVMSDLRVPSVYDKALMKCFKLEIQCRSSSLRFMRDLRSQVSSQRRKALAIMSHNGNSGSEWNHWASTAAELEAELKKYTALERLLDASRCAEWAQGRTRVESKKWLENSRNVFWNAGVDTSEICPSIASLIQYDVKTFKKGETPLPKCQYERLRHDLSNRTIIGARLENCWKSKTNASWRLLDGWPGEHSMEVEFCTQHYRGGHWRFEVWSVDDELCRE